LSGIRLTEDTFVTWRDFSNWIVPIGPERMILVACEAGRWLPSKALFEQIGTLKKIYGSPLPITPHQATAVKFLLPYLLLGGRTSKHGLLVAQAVNFLATGGVIFHQSRREFQRSGTSEAVLWTAVEELMKTSTRRSV